MQENDFAQASHSVRLLTAAMTHRKTNFRYSSTIFRAIILDPAVDRSCFWENRLNSKHYRFLNVHRTGDNAPHAIVGAASCLAALQILAIPPVSAAVCALPASPPHPL